MSLVKSDDVVMCDAYHCVNCAFSKNRALFNNNIEVKFNLQEKLTYSDTVMLFIPGFDKGKRCSMRLVKLLCLLIEYQNQVLSKIDLEKFVWGREGVGEGSLTVLACQLRRLLVDTVYRVITVRGVGYMLINEGLDNV
ncbi:winged helix-turn-helix domain-containing protein [Shewanella sp. Isolate13]|uniref:winged helix-turn-helix domain-containing protein n=1 Tax=Shewanella sp. Isolate13 TaxID=2908531 RepID=UPI001EFE9505|nr:winged helix-turn-helix domain-containing protein [Shewanella sp. Isolate13]MCG9731120.1 winged helix-turn-helix domain-containing protein [Shewanella sp. Isolate13]